MRVIDTRSYLVIIDGGDVGYASEITATSTPAEQSVGLEGQIYFRTGQQTLEINLDRKFEDEEKFDYIRNTYGGSPRERPGWDEYFLGIASAVAARGDCVSRQIGAVIVDKTRRIVSTGYNGVPPSAVGCIKSPCPRAQASTKCPGYSDCLSTHAEANALLYAGVEKSKKATIYISDMPCDMCLKLIKAARIKRVVWPKGELKL